MPSTTMISQLKLPRRLAQGVLGAVEVGDGFQVVEPGAGEVLLSLDGFEDDADGEFLALLGKVETFFRRGEDISSGDELIGQRLPVGEGLDDLADNVVAQLFEGEFGDLQSGFGG